MPTTGRALGHPIGNFVSFTGYDANRTQTFNLPSGFNLLHLSQCDPGNCTTVTLTDNNGRSQSFASHGIFPLGMPGSAANNPITLTVAGDGNGIDYIAIGQHMVGDAQRSQGG